MAHMPGSPDTPASMRFDVRSRSGDYRIRIIATDVVGHRGADFNSRSFRVDRDPPMAAVTGPDFITRYQLNDPRAIAPDAVPQVRFDVRYEASDLRSGVKRVYVAMIKARTVHSKDGLMIVPAEPITVALTADDDVISPARVNLSFVPTWGEGLYFARAIAEDHAGNFSIDLPPEDLRRQLEIGRASCRERV